MANSDREPVGGKKRWVLNQFLSGGATKNPRLDEAHNLADKNVTNVFDSSDEEVVRVVLQRAGLAGHPRYENLVRIFAGALKTQVKDAQSWMNPLYGESSTGQHEVGGGTTTETTATPVRKSEK